MSDQICNPATRQSDWRHETAPGAFHSRQFDPFDLDPKVAFLFLHFQQSRFRQEVHRPWARIALAKISGSDHAYCGMVSPLMTCFAMLQSICANSLASCMTGWNMFSFGIDSCLFSKENEFYLAGESKSSLAEANESSHDKASLFLQERTCLFTQEKPCLRLQEGPDLAF